MNAETAIVFQLTRAFFGPAPSPEAFQALEGPTGWDRVVDVARAHGVSAICHEALARLKGQYLALAEPEGSFLSERRLAAYGSARMGRDLADILGALGERGVVPVLLKGASLGYTVYPEPSLRPMGDLDLLVRAADLTRAQAALATLGYAAQGVAPTRWEEENLIPHLPHQTAPGRIPVEIHFRLFSRAAPLFPHEEEIWARALPITVEGRQALRLSPADELLYLGGHLRKHASSQVQFIWFCDLAMVWRTMGAGDRKAFLELAGRSPQGEEILAVLRTARAWLLGEEPEAAHDLETVMDSPLTAVDRDRPEAFLRMQELFADMPAWGPRVRFMAGYFFPRLSYIRQFHRVQGRWGAWGWRVLRPLWVLGRVLGALRAWWKTGRSTPSPG